MRVKVELIAIELPQFGSAKSRDLDLEAGANVRGRALRAPAWTAIPPCSPW